MPESRGPVSESSEAPVRTAADQASDQAAALYDLDRHEAALSTATKGLASDPEHPTLLWIAVASHLALNHGQDAMDLARRAVSAHPDSKDLRLLWAKSMAAAGWTGDALVMARRLAEREYDHAPSHVLVSSLAHSLGHRDLALRAADRALQLAPESADSHARMSDAYLGADARLADLDSVERAAHHLRAALTIEPGNPQNLLRLAIIHDLRKDPGGSAAQAALSLRIDPSLEPARQIIWRLFLLQILRTHRIVMWFLLVACVVGWAANNQPARSIYAVGLVGVAAAFAAVRLILFRRRLGPSASFIRAFAKAEPLSAAWGVSLVPAVVSVIVMGCVPRPLWYSSALVAPLCVATTIALKWSVVISRNRRHAHPH